MAGGFGFEADHYVYRYDPSAAAPGEKCQSERRACASSAGARHHRSYTVVVSNGGPTPITGAVVTDSFPITLTGVTFMATQTGGATGFSASGSGNINDVVNMPATAKITYKAIGTISNSATGSISDTATVTSPNNVPDPNTANNSATDTDSQ